MNRSGGNSQTEQVADKFCAGFKLLDRYQGNWQQIHANSQNNFTRIKLVAQKIDSLEKSVHGRLQSLDDLNNCCKSLRDMDNQVKSIHNDLSQLEKTIPLIETILTDLKNQREQRDCDHFGQEMETKVQHKMKELLEDSTLRREKMRLDHNRKLELHEQKLMRVMEERRHILEKTFEEEKKRYLEINQSKVD